VLGYETWLSGESGAAATEREALAIQRDFNDPVGAALIVETLAWISAGDGDPERAARRLATAESLWSLTGTTVAAFGPTFGGHHDECVSRIDLALGQRGLANARQSYRYQNLAEAVAGVLDEPRSSARPDGPARRSPTAAGPLTAREREIAGLIARGLSNRAIADRLVISPRTVDGHVERILRRLGFSSRAQIAAWATGDDGQRGG
jgi:DNA-binding CsgD family transcriptional regulator